MIKDDNENNNNTTTNNNNDNDNDNENNDNNNNDNKIVKSFGGFFSLCKLTINNKYLFMRTYKQIIKDYKQ